MRSQVSLEYLILLSLIIIIMIPLIGLFYVYIFDSIKISQARDTVRKIADSVNFVSYGGPGTITYVYVNFPDGINSTFVGNHTILLKLKTTSGVEDIYEDVNPNVIGYLNKLKGYRKVRIVNFGNVIQVGQGLLFTPSPLFFELSRGESGERNDAIKNLLSESLSLNHSLLGGKSDWVTIKNFPDQLNGFESKNFTVNVSVPSDTKSGEYEVNLIAKSKYSDEELPIIIKVIGQLKHLLISFYSDDSYTHEVTKFFPGDTVYYKITSLDEYNYPIETNISYNLTNPDSIVEKNDSKYIDEYLGSFELSRDWAKSHGVWNLSSIAERVVTISNSSTFETKASMPISTKFICNTEDIYASNWWNSSWEERIPITINSKVNITGYQLKMNISYEDGMSPIFSDIRFIYNNIEIPYWIEKYEEGKWAIVWVKTNLTSGNNTLYLYFDNSNAHSVSDPYSIFDFYDDFNKLDSRWYVSSSTQYSISNGILEIKKGAIGLENPLPFNLNDGYIVESKIRYDSNSEKAYSGVLEMSSSRFTAGSNANSDATILYMVNSPSNTSDVRVWIGNGSTNNYNIVSGGKVFDSELGTWYVLADSANSTEAAVWKNGMKMKFYNVSWAKNMSYISLGHFAGGGTADIKDTSYDWIRIRKYVSGISTYFGSVENYHIKKCILNWWNSNWKYRRWVNITEINGRNETNISLKLIFNGSNIDFSKTNGTDLRFILEGEEIPYWVQYWNSTTKSAIVWIKLPYLNEYSTDTVWVYYGNPNANSESNISNVLVNDNIEHGDSNWNYNGLWHITTKRYDSPTHSFWYGNESTGDYDTGSANSGNLTTSHWIHLYDNAYLNYWQYRETEESPYYDHAWVQISTDNSTWTTIDNSYNNDAGSNKTIDISNYSNEDVLIRYYFDTVDQYYNNYEGWYIDDFWIGTYPNESIKIESDAFWWNQSWEKRVPIQVNSSSDLTDYQMKLYIPFEDGMDENYSDVRFVYWNGTDNFKIPYWIESYNSTDAIVWIKTNLTSGDNFVYLYYNNSNANSTSNGSSVFLFFDDFNGSSLSSKWDTSKSSGNYSIKVSNGYVNLTCNTTSSGAIIETANPVTDGSTPFIAEAKGNIKGSINSGNDVRNRFYLLNSKDDKPGTRSSLSDWGLYSNDTQKVQQYWNGYTGVSVNYPDEMLYEHIMDGSNYIWYVGFFNGTKIYTNNISESKLDHNYLYFGAERDSTGNGTSNINLDWVLVRKYTSNEPTYKIGNVENLPKPDMLYWKISLLDQYNSPRVGYFDYEIDHDNNIYKSQSAVHSSIISGNITFNQSFVGYWKIKSYWTDILLPNETEFEVVK